MWPCCHHPTRPASAAPTNLPRRDKADPSAKELKQAARLLRAAAGVDRIGVVRAGGASVGNATAAAGAGAGALTAGQVELVLRNASEAHIPALRELMYAYRSGGCWARWGGAGQVGLRMQSWAGVLGGGASGSV